MDTVNWPNPREKIVHSGLGKNETLPAVQPLPAYEMLSSTILLKSISEVSGSGRGEGTASATQRLRMMAGTVNLMMNARRDIRAISEERDLEKNSRLVKNEE